MFAGLALAVCLSVGLLVFSIGSYDGYAMASPSTGTSRVLASLHLPRHSNRVGRHTMSLSQG